jgi:hypothetical protein
MQGLLVVILAPSTVKRVSPQINPATNQFIPVETSPSQKSGVVMLARYSRAWYEYTGNSLPSGVTQTQYDAQLLWKRPGSNTYITMCPYHAPISGKVTVLWLNGTVKPVDVKTLQNLVPYNDPRYGDFKMQQFGALD